jgi:hypothetical protein
MAALLGWAQSRNLLFLYAVDRERSNRHSANPPLSARPLILYAVDREPLQSLFRQWGRKPLADSSSRRQPTAESVSQEPQPSG